MVPSQKIQDLLKFVAFTQEFQKVKRVILKKDSEEWESGADHSWQLAIVAWYIIQKENLPLNLHKVLQFALVHDLVEIYAGDTYVFANSEMQNSKKQREEVALDRIREEFPDFPQLPLLIQEYEERVSEEVKFVYALDKFLPEVNITLDNGRLRKRNKITYEMMRNNKDKKIALSPDVQRYWEEFVVILEKNKKKVFAE